MCWIFQENLKISRCFRWTRGLIVITLIFSRQDGGLGVKRKAADEVLSRNWAGWWGKERCGGVSERVCECSGVQTLLRRVIDDDGNIDDDDDGVGNE